VIVDDIELVDRGFAQACPQVFDGVAPFTRGPAGVLEEVIATACDGFETAAPQPQRANRLGQLQAFEVGAGHLQQVAGVAAGLEQAHGQLAVGSTRVAE